MPENPVQPTPLDTLTPEAAQERLQSVIREFLDYRRQSAEPSEVRHILIRSPAGLGKTTSTLALIAPYWFASELTLEQIGQMTLDSYGRGDFSTRFLFFVRTHNLASEIKSKAEQQLQEAGSSVKVPIWRGRSNQAQAGNAPCQRWREASLLREHGYSVAANLCQRTASDGTLHECPHFQSCKYINVRRRSSPVTVLMTAELATLGLKKLVWTHSAEPLPYGETGFFDPVTDGRTFVIDESPVEFLVERSELPTGALAEVQTEGLASALREGLQSSDGLVTYLRNAGFGETQLRAASEQQATYESAQGQVANPNDLITLDSLRMRVGESHRYQLSKSLSCLADEVATGREGEAYSLRPADDENVRVQWRQDFRLKEMPGIVLDATGNAELLNQFIPGIHLQADLKVERNAHVTQVSDNTFSKSRLFGHPQAQARRVEALNFARAVAAKTAELPDSPRTLVVTYKKLRRLWTGEADGTLEPSAPIRDSTIDVAHFGALRGLDQFKDHGAVIVIGRNEPSPQDLEEQARAIWYDTPSPLSLAPSDGLPRNRPTAFEMRGGQSIATQISHHPDHRVHMLLEQAREMETLQAIDRLRLVHSDIKKPVYILASIPLPGLRLDRLLRWEELLAGGTKLERCIAHAELSNQQAIILSKGPLAARFPSLWNSEGAARAWLNEQMSGELIRSYIGQWTFKRFRRSGRPGRWQMALARDAANAASCIASALDVLPNEIALGEP